MRTKTQERIKVILNIELQNDYYQKYHFEPRAVFYCARMLSEQLDREFTAENYDDLEKKDVHGSPVKSWKHDYISISFIRLSTGKKQACKHQLINMLDTLFSDEISVNEKKKRLLMRVSLKENLTHILSYSAKGL